MGRHSMPSPQGSYTAVEERAEGRVRADGRARAVDRKTNFDGRRDDGERERECRLRCGGDGVRKERRPSGERERDRAETDLGDCCLRHWHWLGAVWPRRSRSPDRRWRKVDSFLGIHVA